MPQNRRRTKDGNVSKLLSRIVVEHLVDDSIHCGLGNHPAGIEGEWKELTRHVAGGRSHNDEMVDDNAFKGCGEMPDVRMVCVAHWHEKEAHSAAPFFELGEPLAKMSSVIEKVQSCSPRIGR